MPPRTPRLPGAGDVIAGKYRLERLLKQGGMGAVWVATHLGLDERVAVKFMDPRRVSSAEARMRFTREAKAAAQIRSKNIVQILDHGVDSGVPYIAMELLAGEDLGARLRRAGKLSIAEASALLEHIAHALDRAHAAGIVHRDLKPENIFLAKDGDHEIPKILDFGIALEVQPDATDDSAMTQEGVILGTPYFMSPEQVRGRTNIDHRSDLWSVGVIVFRAITGIRPFGRGAPADVIVQICSDPIPRASVVARDLPEEVDRFFEKALAREVARRFSSAKEMAAAFSEIARMAEGDERTQQDFRPSSHDRPSSQGHPSSRDRPSSRGARKGPPPLPGAYQVSPTMPSPGSDADSRDETRPVPVIGGAPETERTSAGPEVERAGESRADAARGAHAEPPIELTPEPIEEGTSEPTPVAAAITGTVPTVEMGSAAATSGRAASDTPTSGAITKPPETPRAAESGSSLVSAPRTKEPRSALWAALGLVLGMAIAGAAFREKLFGPPPGSREPTGAATIVLTAGTVVLMSPGGVSAPPAASASASATDTASVTGSTSASATDTASVTGSTSASAAANASAATSVNAMAPGGGSPADSATASASAAAPGAGAAGASTTSAAQIGMGTVPVVTAKTAPAATPKATPPEGGKTEPPPKKDEHDLGY